MLREHPEIGYRLLEGAGVSPVDRVDPPPPRVVGRQRLPAGLAGDEIPLGSRIILVADAFDAMTLGPAYRAAARRASAIAELRRCCWTQFDARVVAALEEYLGSRSSSQQAEAA